MRRATGAARWLVILIVGLSLIVASGCTARGDADTMVGRVRLGGSTLTWQGVQVVLPEGVAPAGTKVRLHREAQTGTGAAAVPVSDGLTIDLGEGLQPTRPLTLVFPVDAAKLPSTEGSAERLVVRSTSDGEVRLYRGAYDATAGLYTVEVDHLSNFQLFSLDMGKVFEEVRAAMMQGLGVEYPKPDCLDQKAKVGGTSYGVIQPPQTWVCLANDKGNLVVRAHTNSPIPFLVTTRVAAKASTMPSDVKLATSSLVVVAGALGLVGGEQAGVMPGTTAELRFTGAPDAVTLTFEQYPVMLLMSILATTLDTMAAALGIPFAIKDGLDGLQCLVDAAEIAGRGVRLNGETAGGVTRALFDCVGPIVGAALSAKGAVIMAIAGAAPAFLVGSALGVINELTGQQQTKVILDVTQPARPLATEATTNAKASEWDKNGNGVCDPGESLPPAPLDGEWSDASEHDCQYDPDVQIWLDLEDGDSGIP